MSKPQSLNIPLTDKLKEFVVSQSGDDTMYSTPSEYVRDLIRHDYERKAAADLTSSILAGYQDLLEGETVEFNGNLRKNLEELNDQSNG